jgi:hypothetical protein
LDGDLGPYDLPMPRLERADTVFVLDYSLLRCGWQSLRRGRQRLDYWIWVLGYRRRSLPIVVNEISSIALGAEVHVFRTPREARRFLGQLPATADSKKADR